MSSIYKTSELFSAAQLNLNSVVLVKGSGGQGSGQEHI